MNVVINSVPEHPAYRAVEISHLELQGLDSVKSFAVDIYEAALLFGVMIRGVIISGTCICRHMRALAPTSTHAFVYILGGFLVLRWVWARWKERNDKGRAPDDPSS